MSAEFKNFLSSNGVATCRTTAYNPRGNGQVERCNGIVWKTTELALKSRNLPIAEWETVLPQALHSVRSLLCTATNCTPHERMFAHPRQSGNGVSTPSWLLQPGTVLVKRFNRQSKYEPPVEEATLLEGNHDYALIRYSDGRETTVSTRHLAPSHTAELVEDSGTQIIPPIPIPNDVDSTRADEPPAQEEPSSSEAHPPAPRPLTNSAEVPLRRSTRISRPPKYLDDFVRF